MDKKELKEYKEGKKQIYNRLLNGIEKLVGDVERELKELNNKVYKN